MNHATTIEIKGGNTFERQRDLERITRILPFPDGVARTFTMERVYWQWFDELEFYQRDWAEAATWLLSDCPKHAPAKGRSAEEEMQAALRFLVSQLHANLEFRPANDRKLAR